MHIVYAAGPTGFGLQRALRAKGNVCDIIAPSQIPRCPGERVKTDGRDSVRLPARRASVSGGYGGGGATQHGFTGQAANARGASQ